MATSSSSSSSAVDLVEAADAEHDDAMSKLFFSDTRSAGPGCLSWPAESEIPSTLKSQDSLVALCSKHGVPSELISPVCADRLGWNACTPPPVGSNKICVYADALDAGLRFPLHDFYSSVLRNYNLAPSQLTPNSWSYLAAFLLRCQDAGVEPLVSAFRYFFRICAQSHGGKPTGFHHFRPNHLFTGNPPNYNRRGWKSRYFYLDCPSGWMCPEKWGKPRRENARRVQRTATVIKLEAMKCIDIKDLLARHREMPVGDLADLQSAVKVEAGASAAAVGAAAENASTTTRKRSRLSPAAVLSQPQPLLTSPPPGLAPIRVSCTGGSSSHIPPPGLAPIRASSIGGSSRHIPLMGFTPISGSSTGGRSGHIPPPQQQRLSESTSAPWELPGMIARAQAVSIGGSSEVTQPAPHSMSDALQLWEARAKAREQAAIIAKLNHELNLVKTWNAQWQEELRAARDKYAAEKAELMAHLRAANNHLNEEVVRLNKKHVADREQLIGHLRTAIVEIEQLKADHAEESAQLRKDLGAEAKQLKEHLAEDAEQLKHEGYIVGASKMRDLALAMSKGAISPDELKVEMLLDHDHQIDQIQAASPLAVEDQ